MADGFQRTSAIGGRAYGRGQGHAREGAARTARGISSCVRAARSGNHPRRAGEDASRLSGAHPLCADACQPVCVSARVGRHHGGRSGEHSGNGCARPGLRGCARRQFRRVRIGGAQPRFCDQRFRRDAARTVGMGFETPGRQRFRGRALSRRRQGDVRGFGTLVGDELPQAHARLCADVTLGRLVRDYRRKGRPGGAFVGGARWREAGHGEGAPAKPLAGTGEEGATHRRSASYRRGQATDRQGDAHYGGHPIAKVVDHTLHVYMDSLPEERRTLFARYRVVDVARKVVGVGSVGTRCWVFC